MLHSRFSQIIDWICLCDHSSAHAVDSKMCPRLPNWSKLACMPGSRNASLSLGYKWWGFQICGLVWGGLACEPAKTPMLDRQHHREAQALRKLESRFGSLMIGTENQKDYGSVGVWMPD